MASVNKDLLKRVIKYYISSFLITTIIGGLLIWVEINSGITLEIAYFYSLVFVWIFLSRDIGFKSLFVHYVFLFIAYAILVFFIMDAIELTSIPRCLLFHCFDNLIYVAIRMFEEKTGVVVKTNK